MKVTKPVSGHKIQPVIKMLQDSLIEKHPSASFHPVFATFGNAENTYTHSSMPERIDYLMYRAKSHLDMKVIAW